MSVSTPHIPVNETSLDPFLEFETAMDLSGSASAAVKLTVRMIKANQETWEGR